MEWIAPPPSGAGGREVWAVSDGAWSSQHGTAGWGAAVQRYGGDRLSRGGAMGSVGHGVDDQDNTQRGGAIGPHAHGNTARHGVVDLNVEGSGLQKP